MPPPPPAAIFPVPASNHTASHDRGIQEPRDVGYGQREGDREREKRGKERKREREEHNRWISLRYSPLPHINQPVYAEAVVH